MEQYPAHPEIDSAHRIVPPLEEVLLDRSFSEAIWPLVAAEIGPQVARRAEQVRTIESVLDVIPGPTTELETAVEDGIVSKHQASELYTALSDTLAGDDNIRLALYLPFQLLPRAGWLPEDSALAESARRFTDTYLLAWSRLLGVHDARANFVDGDVLETEARRGDLPRVVKAAHLIPALLSKGLIAEEGVIALAEKTRDDVLRRSITEALQAYHGHEPVGDTIRILAAEEATDISENRRAWLALRDKEAALNQRASEIAREIEGNAAAAATYADRLHEESELSKSAIAEGIYGAIERTAQRDIQAATKLFDMCATPLFNLWSDHPEENVQNRLTSVFRRLNRLGLLDVAALDTLGVAIPDLGGPFSANLSRLQPDMDRLQAIQEQLRTDPELQRIVYPVIAVGGSRVKGYGERTSDIDVSVFMRPGVSYEHYADIRKSLEAAFGTYEPIEFWLENSGEGLRIRDIPQPELHTADGHWTHLLFNTAWLGDMTAIAELQQELLPRYFHADALSPGGQPARQHYLERLEQDAVQYRLMHKGYGRHYPMQPRPDWTRQTSIDGDSAFWDPGYRRVATRLFLQHVFLPKI